MRYPGCQGQVREYQRVSECQRATARPRDEQRDSLGWVYGRTEQIGNKMDGWDAVRWMRKIWDKV